MIVANSIAIEGKGVGAVDEGRLAPVGVTSILEQNITNESDYEKEMFVADSFAIEGKELWVVDEGIHNTSKIGRT